MCQQLKALTSLLNDESCTLDEMLVGIDSLENDIRAYEKNRR